MHCRPSYLRVWIDRPPCYYRFVTDSTVSSRADARLRRRRLLPARQAPRRSDAPPLAHACEKLGVYAPIFTHVVHISTDAVTATYGASQEPTMCQGLVRIESGRLIILGKWLERLNEAAHNSKWDPSTATGRTEFVQIRAMAWYLVS